VQTSIWLWVGFNAFVLILLALDLGLLHRKQREIAVREALLLSAFYFLLAMVFNAGVFHFRGEQAGLDFLTGYLIEKSLSIDNIFVFVLVFTHFAVPPQYQHRVLFWGILGALTMRGTLIYFGSELIAQFHWIIYVFGAFLVASGIKMLIAVDSEPDIENNRLIRFMRSRFRVTDGFEGQRFFVRREGKLWMTPLLLVLILIEFTDLVFAVDSIPAIFAITTDPFIVYTSNVFAILGLRALYFALAGIIHRFRYLKYGLSLVLIVIGAKMLLVDIYKMPTAIALAITGALIGGSILLSLAKTGREGEKSERRGWIPGSPNRAEPSDQK
jgi:tellurite resistance protein TerC